jgi:hypothetical protein
MCDICRFVSDGIEGRLFITSKPTCPRGRELAAARHVEIMRLPLPPVYEETQWDVLAVLDSDEGVA